MRKRITILFILSLFLLIGCTDAKKNAFNLAVEKLNSIYTLGQVDDYNPNNVTFYDYAEDPNDYYYSVDVFYEAKTNAGTLNRFSSNCDVPKNAKSFLEVSCSD